MPCPTCGKDIGNMSMHSLSPAMGPPNMLRPVYTSHEKCLDRITMQSMSRPQGIMLQISLIILNFPKESLIIILFKHLIF